MNKKLILWVVSGIAVIAVVTVGVFGIVNAQTPTPTPGAPQGNGFGMRGGMMERGGTMERGKMMEQGTMPGRGGMMEQGNMPGRGGMMEQGNMPGRGGMMERGAFDFAGKMGTQHEEMVKAFADKLGLTVDAVNTRLKAGESFAKIAESKGITADKLPAFMKEVYTKVLDAAVAAGKLTQAQADAIKAKMADANWSEMGGGKGMGLAPKADQNGSGRMGKGGMMDKGGMMGTQDGWMHDEMVKALSAKLGLTVDEINTRLKAGESLVKIAESKGVTGEAFTALVKEAQTKAIDAALAAGTITQAQADAFKARLDKSGMPMMGGAGKGGMMPFGGGRRGR